MASGEDIKSTDPSATALQYPFSTIETELRAYHPSPNIELIKKAYDYALKEHHGQVRRSGDPYFSHVYEATRIGCALRLDEPTIASILLHDTIEDCGVDREALEKTFGVEVSEIVEGVTKLTRIEFDSKEEKQAENFRKMLLAMAKDIRVVLVKLCDRLHNMRTLSTQREERKRAIAQETKDIYAPLANRLGIHWLKSELEDLCLLYLRPEIYKLIEENFNKTAAERDTYIQETTEDIVTHLKEVGLSGTVVGRAKHYASIWKKMEEEKKTFEEVTDLLGFRILVPTRHACYEALGVMHSVYKPVPGRFKDFIAMPKPNMYQSLHTTVIGPEGMRVEIQIRTPEMHQIAEEGIAAHWRYKEGKNVGADGGFDLKWVKELVDSQAYLKSPDEFISSVKSDLFPEEVFIFTPKGDLFRLPHSSTPVDFAYAVHTDVGQRTTGAKVNGTMVPLSHKLQNGDTVEIITNKNHVPSKDWLKFVQTSKAKQRIRAFIKSQEHARAIALGMELLTKEMRKHKIAMKRLEGSGELLKIAQSFGSKSEGDLFAEIGYGKILPSKVSEKLPPELLTQEQQQAAALLQQTTATSGGAPTPLRRIFHSAALSSRAKMGVLVEGADGVVVRFAKCCDPLPGDRIVGFVTRGRGVSVHHAECSQVHGIDPNRRVEVQWNDTSVKQSRRVRLLITSQDQVGLLANMSRAITDSGANIIAAQIRTNENGKAVNTFELQIKDAPHLEKVRRSIEMVPGVISVDRIMPLMQNPEEKES